MNRYITIIISLLILFVGCDDKLDIIPEDDVSQGAIFTTSSGAELAVVGLYSKIQDADVFNGTPQAMTEWQSDNVGFVGSFPTFVQIRDYTTLANNTSIQAIWRDHFETVMAANYVIEGVQNLEELGFSDADKNSLIAEARFIRAIIYFNLANLFSQPYQINNGSSDCLPIIDFTFSGNSEPFEVPRSDVNTVHNFIKEDLDYAIANLTGSDRSKATVGAAKAMKARLHLYREEWADAATLANQVIGDSNFAFASDYTFFQNEADKEHVFVLVNTAEDSQNSNEGFSGLFNASPEGRGDAPFSTYLLNAFDQAADRRYTDLIETGANAEGVTATFTAKYVDGVNNADNALIIRISEMYFIRAEANFKAGTSVGATPLADINKIRDRAGLADLTAVDMDVILDEKRKEFCFEGLRRMDLLRNSRALRPSGDPNFAASAAGANKTIWPIPTRERDLNTALTQNAGY